MTIQPKLDIIKQQVVAIEAEISTTPPPGPVDCVLSPWVLTSSGPWGPCVNGIQVRNDTYARTVVTSSANGGAPCGPLSEIRSITQACGVPPPTPGAILQASNLSVAGAFRLPTVMASMPNLGTIDLYGYTNPGIAVSDHGTIYIPGHITGAQGKVAEISLPALKSGPVAGLNIATQIRPHTQVAGLPVGGILQWGSRLIVTGYVNYDANNGQTLSHWTSDLSFGTPTGPFKVSNSLGKAGFVSGYLSEIPPEWQAGLGGTHATGNSNLNIISRTSNGPTLTVFDPNRLADSGGAIGTTLLGYPLSHDTMNCLRVTRCAGMVFIPGTRTVLFIGRSGTNQLVAHDGLAALPVRETYGNATTNKADHGKLEANGDRLGYDPVFGSKGPHAWPYLTKVWAYDVLHLIDVREGRKLPWEILPYAEWSLPIPAGYVGQGNELRGAAYHEASKTLYIPAYGGDGSKSLIVAFTVS